MSRATVESVLTKALALIREGWTQRALARDAAGRVVSPSDPLAVCRCLAGAIQTAAGPAHTVRTRARTCLGNVLYFGEFDGRFRRFDILSFNDDAATTQLQVEALILRGLANCSEKKRKRETPEAMRAWREALRGPK